MTEIGDLSLILVGTIYEGVIPCIQATFDSVGIKTLNDLDNAPKKLNFCMCDFDTYPLLSVVRERTLNPPPSPEPKATKKRAEKASAKVKETEQEVKEVEPVIAEPETVVEDDQEAKE